MWALRAGCQKPAYDARCPGEVRVLGQLRLIGSAGGDRPPSSTGHWHFFAAYAVTSALVNATLPGPGEGFR